MQTRLVAIAGALMLTLVVGAFSFAPSSRAIPDAGSANHSRSAERTPCVQQVACGGAFVLVAGASVAAAVLAGSPRVQSQQTSAARLRPLVGHVSSRLAAERLFRPPRTSF